MNEVLMAGHRIEGSSGYSFDYHSHQEYEIYFFHAGSCRYLIHNQIYDLRPGDILLMDGMTLHRPNVLNQEEYVRSVIHFSPKWISGIINELGSHYLLEIFQHLQHCLIRSNESKELMELESLIQRMDVLGNHINNKDIKFETELKVLLLQVLIIVHRLSKNKLPEIPNKKDTKAEYTESIAVYIQENFEKKVTLDNISKDLNISKSYISHIFKEVTGFTVMEYLMECRLTQVKYSLEMEPKKPLKDIAFDCGFESVAHFSRYFRKKIGMTAKEYRRLRLKSV
ncbi:AraC family transcriptional regulator [Salipaludibacillus sp. HK11]|uniref:helix-turn-helix transcriptional regulator n=1 Tax=Salipaludibacillus sp. HK11 TaxID=3394320 RepID=UPI0039FCE0F3